MIPTTPTIGARLRLSYGVVFLLMICLSALVGRSGVPGQALAEPVGELEA